MGNVVLGMRVTVTGSLSMVPVGIVTVTVEPPSPTSPLKTWTGTVISNGAPLYTITLN